MFAPTSRYANVEKTQVVDQDGRVATYIKRRFLPRAEEMPLLAEVTVTEGDRLDLITARTLGDPEQFWRVCDANNALNPTDLTAESGTAIRVPVPQF
jgi:hypothetical protein